MNEKRSKLGICPHMKYGNPPRGNSCQSGKESQESGKCNNLKRLERLEKESEAELEKARKAYRKTERTVKQNRKCSPDSSCKSVQKPATTACKSDPIDDSREAIKRLTKLSVPKENECSDERTRRKSDGNITSCMSRLPAYCTQELPEEDIKEFPRKPKLTPEELNELLDQEAKDVESAWLLTSETKELYKKPCPKQQKARDAVKALIEPKKEEPQPCLLSTSIPKEPLPFLDPEPDDISPEVAANMMYTQERGIRMISCPEETVRHLFAGSIGLYENNKKDDIQDEFFDPDLDETAQIDDSVYTRNMGQKDNGSKNFDTPNTLSDRKTEFVLQEKETKCVNKVQLRGNCAPWFPGYYIAFPDHAGELGVQVAKSPSGIFQKAWMAAKPNNVPASDLYLIE